MVIKLVLVSGNKLLYEGVEINIQFYALILFVVLVRIEVE